MFLDEAQATPTSDNTVTEPACAALLATALDALTGIRTKHNNAERQGRSGGALSA